jgi:AcrR family transcriptional regulator
LEDPRARASTTQQPAVTGEIALILAAERLFAERGIEAVALRQINQAANQRNMSAAHYHFGSREGLVEAVLRHRLPALDARRGAMLADSGTGRDLRFYLRAFIMPLIEELRPRPEGNHYLRFMQQYERYRGSYDFVRALTPTSVEIYDGIEALLGELPEPIRRLRIGHLINLIHSVLVTVEERVERGEIDADQLELITANTVDMIAGALTAPPSAEALAQLERCSPGA